MATAVAWLELPVLGWDAGLGSDQQTFLQPQHLPEGHPDLSQFLGNVATQMITHENNARP